MVTLGIICIICIVGFIGCGMTSKDGRTQAHENQPLALVQVGEKWGFIDTTGKFVIEPQFLDAKNFQ